MSRIPDHAYRGWISHLEHGTWVWYRSAAWRMMGTQPNGTRKHNGLSPTKIDRIVTNATDIEDAKAQLDRAIDGKREPKEDLRGNYKLDF